MKPANAPAHLPAMDGIRGLAILFVIAFHCRAPLLDSTEIPFPLFSFLGLGWSGVELFFVLSGFLITGILLDTREDPAYFRIFYTRRALRIFPLYFAYVLLVLGVFQAIAVLWLHQNPWSATNPIYYLTYTFNLKPLGGADDQWLDHLWSLAVEEQFYLIWPAVVLFCSRARLRSICAVLMAAALGARIYGGMLSLNTEWLYRLTPCHMDSLAAGALVAIGVRESRDRLARLTRRIMPLALFSFAVVASNSRNPVWSDWQMRTLGVSLIALIYGSIVATAATSPEGLLARACCWAPLRSIGKYSYAMYVLHSAPFRIVAPMLQRMPMTGGFLPRPWLLALKYLFFPAMVAFAYGAARLSYIVLEGPFLRLKDRFPYTGTGHNRRSLEMEAAQPITR
jgi:peptidoglycan/LPS O-acetylase OafA/YrhL